ncbi:hypothetical protein M8818_003160 [Zalaria obscura]|uniref:Uncharacterized protein n=1 Tax=Zalaria obscura TaxID=2024903 RepID=A0ACC3SFT7_9PEZI
MPDMDDKPARASKACDACKLRKVKCNGHTPCQQCNHLNLRCLYSTVKLRGKQSKRGHLIARYKQKVSQESRSKSLVSTPLEVQSQQVPSEESQTLPGLATMLPEHALLPAWTPASSPLPYDTSFFSSFLHDYEVSVYPVNPIISPTEVMSLIAEMHQDDEARAFIFSLVAVTIDLTHCSPDQSMSTGEQVEYWAKQTIFTRRPMMLDDKVSIRRIMTAQFLHIVLMGLRKGGPAFYYLRESITMIQMLRVNDPTVMSSLSLQERARRQRLYWEAFIHERFYAITEYRTTVLSLLQGLPEYDDSTPRGIHDGFCQIIKLFTLIDADFLSIWLADDASDKSLTAEWIEDKHRQIDAEPAGEDGLISDLTDLQQSDLIITKHWLRNLVWQMAMSKCLLSSTASNRAMSLLFPVRLSSRLRNLLTKMSRESVEIHGSGIQQKLFELTDTIANVIITVPGASMEETASRVNDFTFLINFLFSLPRFNPAEKAHLQKKLEKLQSMFPYSSTTSPESVTTPSISAVGNASLGRDDPWLSVLQNNIEPEPQEGPSLWQPISPDGPPNPNFQGPWHNLAPRHVYTDMVRTLSRAPEDFITWNSG